MISKAADHMTKLTSTSGDMTKRIGVELGVLAEPGDIIVLGGELGAGKTTLTKGIAAGLGIAEPVRSPTFTLIHEFTGRIRLLHVDLYRLDSRAAVESLGLEHVFDTDAVTVIEWGDRFATMFGRDRLDIILEYDHFPSDSADTSNVRHIEIRPVGKRWQNRTELLAGRVSATEVG